MSNLPKWRGAQAVYSRAYAMLTSMSRSHVSIVRGYCVVSDDMRLIIDALNSGDEERIKGLLLDCDCLPGESVNAIEEYASR